MTNCDKERQKRKRGQFCGERGNIYRKTRFIIKKVLGRLHNCCAFLDFLFIIYAYYRSTVHFFQMSRVNLTNADFVKKSNTVLHCIALCISTFLLKTAVNRIDLKLKFRGTFHQSCCLSQVEKSLQSMCCLIKHNRILLLYDILHVPKIVYR